MRSPWGRDPGQAEVRQGLHQSASVHSCSYPLLFICFISGPVEHSLSALCLDYGGPVVLRGT